MEASNGAYFGSFGYQQPFPYGYQPGIMYPPYGLVLHSLLILIFLKKEKLTRTKTFVRHVLHGNESKQLRSTADSTCCACFKKLHMLFPSVCIFAQTLIA